MYKYKLRPIMDVNSMSMKTVLAEAPSVSDIVSAGGRIEMKKDGQVYYVEVKAGLKPSGSYRNAEWLQEHYVDKGLTMQELADMFNVTPMTIYGWLQKHGIETRGRGRRA